MQAQVLGQVQGQSRGRDGDRVSQRLLLIEQTDVFPLLMLIAYHVVALSCLCARVVCSLFCGEMCERMGTVSLALRRACVFSLRFSVTFSLAGRYRSGVVLPAASLRGCHRVHDLVTEHSWNHVR